MKRNLSFEDPGWAVNHVVLQEQIASEMTLEMILILGDILMYRSVSSPSRDW